MVVMVSSTVSSRFEKVVQPSNREDIDSHHRGQLGLDTTTRQESTFATSAAQSRPGTDFRAPSAREKLGDGEVEFLV
jgi:hypothetical protein